MTDEEWETVALVLSKAWKGEFGPGEDRAYRMMLDAYSGEQIVLALRKIAASGHHVFPTVSEIVQAIEADPSTPTFEEAYRLIYGPGGILRARPARRVFDDAAEKEHAERQAMRARGRELHPLVATFADRYGYDRLRMLEVDDLDHGELVIKGLREAWDRHCEAMQGRDVAALAERGERRASLQKFDPLAALGGGLEGLAAVTAGTVKGED